MKSSVDNTRIADALAEIGLYLDAEGVAFKPHAYAVAAQTIRTLDRDAAALVRTCGEKCLDDLPGIGASIAAKIVEMVTTGTIKEQAVLKKKYPFDILSITSVPGIGPKTAMAFWKKLRTKTVADVEKVARTGTIAALRGFGKKHALRVLEGLEIAKRRTGRVLLHDAWPFGQAVAETLRRLKGVERCEVAGSLRRRKETVGDIDLVASSEDPALVARMFTKLPRVTRVIERGPQMVRVRFANGMGGDLRVMKPENWASGLHHFTGSKEHNVLLRTLAEKKGWKLSEYGLFDGKRRLDSGTEESIYAAFDLPWIPPELREGRDEIDAAARHRLPKLIDYDDIRGDLQVQTTWTDGAASIADMAAKAKRFGLSYIAVTDHTHSLAVTHGLTAKQLAKQGKEIDVLNDKQKGFRIFKSTECDIHPDGTLDLPDEALARLDFVCVSVHSRFSLDEKTMTERLVRALAHPLVNVLFHPTGRILNRREPYKLDFPRLLRAAKKFGVALEVNASDRLDLSSDHVREALKAGVKLIINSDAHAPVQFNNLAFGIAQARRGWAEASDVLNTKPATAFLKALKSLKK